MSAQGLIISLVLSGIGIAWIVIPFLRRDLGTVVDNQSPHKMQHEQLLLQYEQIIATIRELDEDYSTSKVPPDEYDRERPLWAQRGVEVLKQLDQLEQEHPALRAAAKTSDDRAIDDAIEAAISRYLDEPVGES
jgi:hypothetical protein